MRTFETLTSNYLVLATLMGYLGDEHVLLLVYLNKTIHGHVKSHKKTREMARHAKEYDLAWRVAGFQRKFLFQSAARLGNIRLAKKFTPADMWKEIRMNQTALQTTLKTIIFKRDFEMCRLILGNPRFVAFGPLICSALRRAFKEHIIVDDVEMIRVLGSLLMRQQSMERRLIVRRTEANNGVLLPHSTVLEEAFFFNSTQVGAINCLKFFVERLHFDLLYGGDETAQCHVVKMAGLAAKRDELIPYILSKGVRIRENHLICYIRYANLGALKYLWRVNPALTLGAIQRPVFAALQLHSIEEDEGLRMRLELVELLLEKGAEVDETDPETGYTVLMEAVFRNNVKVAERLIEFGADLEVTHDNGQSAVHLIRSVRMLDALFAKGANVHKVTPRDGNLFNIFFRGDLFDNDPTHSRVEELKIRRRLSEIGVDLNVPAKNRGGKTPLHGILHLLGLCRRPDLTVLHEILGYGPDLNVRDDEGKTPLFTYFTTVEDFRKRCDPEIVETMLRRGADIDVIDLEGRNLRDCYVGIFSLHVYQKKILQTPI